MLARRPLVATLLLALPLAAGGGCETETDALYPQRTATAWEVVWADDFEGAAGEAPDPSRWTYDLGRGDNGWGNAELQHYTDRADNVALTGDGQLAITARAEPFAGADYTSARLKTQGLFSFTYGRVEARIALPVGAGLWPAFWMLGENITEVGWPRCGEIDIMEYRGQSTDNASGAVHRPGYSGSSPLGASYFLPEGQGFDEGFHVFAVEWDPGRIAWLVDETVFHVVTTGKMPADGDWVFDRPFFLLLNVAVGGTFVGPPDATTPFPQTMLVDYVRVLKRAE